METRTRRVQEFAMSLMDMARARAMQGPADGGVTAAPMGGPATRAVPAGNTGVGLDAVAAARSEAFQKLQALRTNAAKLLPQMGQDQYQAALEDLHAKAAAADAQYRQAAQAAGVGQFTE